MTYVIYKYILPNTLPNKPPPTYLSINLLIHLLTYLSTYLPTYLSRHFSTYFPTYLPTYLSTCLPTYFLIYLPIYLPTHLQGSQHICDRHLILVVLTHCSINMKELVKPYCFVLTISVRTFRRSFHLILLSFFLKFGTKYLFCSEHWSFTYIQHIYLISK